MASNEPSATGHKYCLLGQGGYLVCYICQSVC